MSDNTCTLRVRKGQGEVTLSREEFERRLRERFADPAFDAAGDALQRIVDIAWTAYHTYRKTPRTRKAGPGFADPDFDLPVEWLDTRERIQLAQREHQDPAGRSRVLLVCGAARTDQTLPGEMSKTYRLTEMAREEIERANVHCDLLDLSHLTAEYGRQIATSAFRKKCATPRALVEAVKLARAGQFPRPDRTLLDPRPK